MTWLYRTEAKGIQDYVLATNKLREMAGASGLVESLEARLRELVERAGGRVIAAAAGGATICFAEKSGLEAFCRFWPLRVARAAPGLAVVQAWEEFASEDDMTRADSQVRAKLRGASSRPWVDLPEAGPWVARAGRTGLPAIVVDDVPNAGRIERDGSVDAATAAKLSYFLGERGDDETGRDVLGEKLRPAGGARLAKTSDELGDGYVAVIHADGNGIGAALSKRKLDAKEFQAFAKGLKDATEEAAKEAVAGTWPEQRGGVLKIRPIVLGGDDLTVIVEASRALPFTCAFLEAFERKTVDKLQATIGHGFTAAAGLAFVKVGFPFHQAYELSEELCKVAKDRKEKVVPKRSDGQRASALAFHRVTTAMARSWNQTSDIDLAADGKGVLFAGPWTIGRLKHLQELALEFTRLPRGAVREWLRIVKDSRERAQSHWERTRHVAQDRYELKDLDDALKRLEVEPTTLWMNANATPVHEALAWLSIDRNVSLGAHQPALEAARGGA